VEATQQVQDLAAFQNHGRVFLRFQGLVAFFVALKPSNILAGVESVVSGQISVREMALRGDFGDWC